MNSPETQEAPAGVGHNSAGVGEMIKEDPKIIYGEEGMVEQYLAELEARIDAHVVDLTTNAGRDQVRKLAADMSREKAPLESAGLELTEGFRAQTAAVNAKKTAILKGLDRLRVKARQPLTDWEAAEADRAKAINAVMDAIEDLSRIFPGASADSILGRIEQLEEMIISMDVFGAKHADAIHDRDAAIETLKTAHAAAVKAEADHAELERLRAESAAREAEDKRQADAKAARAAQRAHDKEVADRAAAKAKAKAERDAQEAADALQAERDAEAAAKVAAAEAEAAAAREALKAKEAEDRRAREKAEADQAEADRRQGDNDHRLAVETKAAEAIRDQGGVSFETAGGIVMAIATGKIPGVTITY